MRNLPVHWREGLFLRPHHFQAADRYWSELVQTSQQWDQPYGYGLESFEFSPEALANGHLGVRTIRARMRDGTLVSLGAGQEPDRLSLKQGLVDGARANADLGRAFETESVIRVFLAVPKLKLGQSNVASGGSRNGDATAARFHGIRNVIQDEDAGGNDQEVELRQLNVELRLSTQDLSGYEVLPIAQIKRAGDSQAVPRLDVEYVPPVLSIATP